MASLKYKTPFLDALHQEIDLQKEYLGNTTINTIYFGGGTPSLLEYSEIQSILENLNRNYNIKGDAEITFEANPDDLDNNKIRELKRSSVNRLSIGVQSFYDDDLRYLNRIHDGNQAEKSIVSAQDAGFSNITIDLIYGIPTLTNEKWLNNLNKFVSLNLPHLSAYALTVEPKTALKLMIDKKLSPPVDEQQIVKHFSTLVDVTQKNEYIHYEISNFAREGYYSKHNSIYWMGGHYLGLGPSAHSYNGISRQWNVSNITKYNELVNYNEIVYEKEVLSPVQQFNEYILTSLRTIWGCDLEHIENVFGKEWGDSCLQKAQQYLDDKKLELKGNKLFLTPEGKLYADGIASELFRD